MHHQIFLHFGQLGYIRIFGVILALSADTSPLEEQTKSFDFIVLSFLVIL